MKQKFNEMLLSACKLKCFTLEWLTVGTSQIMIQKYFRLTGFKPTIFSSIYWLLYWLGCRSHNGNTANIFMFNWKLPHVQWGAPPVEYDVHNQKSWSTSMSGLNAVNRTTDFFHGSECSRWSSCQWLSVW